MPTYGLKNGTVLLQFRYLKWPLNTIDLSCFVQSLMKMSLELCENTDHPSSLLLECNLLEQSYNHLWACTFRVKDRPGSQTDVGTDLVEFHGNQFGSENKVPLKPLVEHRFPYEDCHNQGVSSISKAILVPQTGEPSLLFRCWTCPSTPQGANLKPQSHQSFRSSSWDVSYIVPGLNGHEWASAASSGDCGPIFRGGQNWVPQSLDGQY